MKKKMSSDEIVGMLQAEEMALEGDKIARGIALKVSKDEDDSESERSDEDEVSLITRKVAKILQQRRAKQNSSQRKTQNGSSSNVQTSDRQTKDKQKLKGEAKVKDDVSDFKGIRCYECEGYGHIRAECPNFKKKEQKSLQSTWSDDEESDVIAFIASDIPGNSETISDTVSETNGEDDDDQEIIVDMDKLVSMYHKVRANFKAADAENKRLGTWINKMEKQIDESNDLITNLNKEIDKLDVKNEDLRTERDNVILLSRQNENKVAKLKMQIIHDQKINDDVVAENERLKNEIADLRAKIDKQEETLRMLNTGKAHLNDVLSMGKVAGDHTGIGF